MAPPKQSPKVASSRLETTSEERRLLDDTARGTILYLAYGSNLSVETFRGNRGIRPLSQINVQVPTLRLTFDLPGIPYAEPCFANSGIRDPEKDKPSNFIDFSDESKARQHDGGYHKDNWHKGLIGVVYEVTPEDYAHIIATEGGGAGYQDILVDCHPFETSNPKVGVPQTPLTPAFRAHTLFAPRSPEGSKPPKHGGRLGRHNPSYAQPSARYLKLITDGAAELDLPYEYQHYLRAIRPYTITTNRQRVGKALFVGFWMPIIMLIFALGRMFADENGLQPIWLRRLSGAVFKSVWTSYDAVFRPVFGDGERSIPDHNHTLPLVERDTSGYDKSLAASEDTMLINGTDIEEAALQSLI